MSLFDFAFIFIFFFENPQKVKWLFFIFQSAQIVREKREKENMRASLVCVNVWPSFFLCIYGVVVVGRLRVARWVFTSSWKSLQPTTIRERLGTTRACVYRKIKKKQRKKKNFSFLSSWDERERERKFQTDKNEIENIYTHTYNTYTRGHMVRFF